MEDGKISTPRSNAISPSFGEGPLLHRQCGPRNREDDGAQTGTLQPRRERAARFGTADFAPGWGYRKRSRFHKKRTR